MNPKEITGNEVPPEMKEYPSFPSYFNYLLLILPSVFGLLWIWCYSQSKTFFSTYPDSIYIYLINGTNIAGGNLDIGHFDNPGTPVHWLGGLIIYIVHLFAGKHAVYEDVLADPEFYLRFCVSFFALLLLIIVYLSGRLILRHTGNLAQALLFQLLPVCSFFVTQYLLLVRMCPENLMIAVLVYYFAFLWVLSYKRDFFPGSAYGRKSHLLFFSFISALLLTTKMTCLPFLVVPFFFLKKRWQKAAFVILTIIIGGIILYPVWPKLPEMFGWFTQLATHSGKYGNGAAGVSMQALLSNLVLLFEHEAFFTVGYFLLLAVLVAALTRKKQKTQLFRFMLACWLICTAQLALASKQFGYHYLIAAQLSVIPAIVAGYYLWNSLRENKKIITGLFVLCICWFGFKVSRSVPAYTRVNKIYQSSIEARKYDGLPRIITTGYQGACFIESGIRFGASYGGPDYFASDYFLRKQYPYSSFYDMNRAEHIIRQWDVNYRPYDYFRDKPRVLVYFINMQENEEWNELKNMTDGLGSFVQIRLTEKNPETAEHFYMIETDTAKMRMHYVKTVEQYYDFERTNKDNTSFVSADGTCTIGEVKTRSDENPFSGKYSIKIPPGQYTCCVTFDADPGDAVEVAVKYHAPDRPVGIILSAEQPGTLDFNSESIMGEEADGWKRSSLKATVPLTFSGKRLNLCLYYFGHRECYADDLDIKIMKSGHPSGYEAPSWLGDLHSFVLKAEGGKYVGIGENGILAANQDDEAKAGRFEKTDLGNGWIAFKASNGKYVSADRMRGSVLFANRSAAAGWESFRISGDDLHAVHLETTEGMFVCSDHSSGDRLTGDKFRASTWETFEVIKK